MRDLLFGTGEQELSPSLFWRCAKTQAALAGWKMTILPAAVLSILPAARAAAFFRIAPVWADRPVSDMLATARNHSRRDGMSNWVALPLLAAFSVCIFINVAVAIGGLPHLVKALTGYESTFTRMGSGIVSQPLFWLVSALCSWMVIDPLFQAFYCVRSFEAHSVLSGADLTARLRAIRKPVAAALLLFALLPVASLNAEVPPTDLERAVSSTLKSHSYDWRLPQEVEASGSDAWIVRVTERMVNQIGEIWKQFKQWLDRLSRQRRGESGFEGPPSASGGPLYVLIAIIVVVAAGFLVLRILARRAPAAKSLGSIPLAAVDLNDQNLTADRLPEEEWLGLAEQLAQDGDFRAALRALYLGNLAWLHSRELITIHSGKTNFEYQREFNRRGRSAPAAPGLLAGNIATFERVWYGAHLAGREDLGSFQQRFQRMKELFA